MNPRRSTDSLEDMLAAQRERLEQLRVWERELDSLNALETDLEVEKIGAEVALQSTTAKRDFGIDSADAAEIAEALARKRQLERVMLPPDDPSKSGNGNGSDMEQLRHGIETLNTWLDAAASAAGWRHPKVAYAFIGLACLAVIGAALIVHVMLLVLLVPLVMALGYLAFTDRDADWIRLGAARRFGQTMLSPPSAWDTPAVESRLRELEFTLAGAESRLADSDGVEDAQGDYPKAQGASEVALALELVEAGDRLDAALRKAQIDPGSIDDEFEKWLQQIHDAHRMADELAETKTKRKALNQLAEETRDTIFRFLALNDAAPTGGLAEVEALAAGLQRIAERHKEQQR